MQLTHEKHPVELFLAQAQRLTKTGSLWWKPSTGEVVWSDENYRMLEYPIGTTPTADMAISRCHPEDVALVHATLGEAIREGTSVDFEHRLLMPNGAIKHVRVVFQNIAADGSEPEFLGASIDITEWKQAEEKLRNSEARLAELRSELAHVAKVTSLGMLTASIAHEVNQPLSGIVTNASTCLRMLASDPPNIEGARETARRAIRDGNRAAQVISHLRTLFSREPPAAQPVNLNDATSEVIALCRRELQRGNTTLHADFADDIPLVMGDRIQLQQVVINLLRNAVEAMRDVDDRPREIVISTVRDANRCVRLTVRDVGIGLAPDSADKLFDPFYTTKDGGMGIGLSVCQSIIKSHNGRLWATPNDGPGITFSFTIPCITQETEDGFRTVGC